MQYIISASSTYYAVPMPHTGRGGRSSVKLDWAQEMLKCHCFLNFYSSFHGSQYLCTQLHIKWPRCALQRKAKSSDKPKLGWWGWLAWLAWWGWFGRWECSFFIQGWSDSISSDGVTIHLGAALQLCLECTVSMAQTLCTRKAKRQRTLTSRM